MNVPNPKTTAEQNPLEMGLVVLTAGLIAGFLLPTPRGVNESMGATANKLRTRAREAGAELLGKAQRVAEDSLGAAKEEAAAQGFTADTMREQASAFTKRVKEAVSESAKREGLVGDDGRERSV